MHLIVYDDTFFYRQILSSGDSDLNTLTFAYRCEIMHNCFIQFIQFKAYL